MPDRQPMLKELAPTLPSTTTGLFCLLSCIQIRFSLRDCLLLCSCIGQEYLRPVVVGERLAARSQDSVEKDKSVYGLSARFYAYLLTNRLLSVIVLDSLEENSSDEQIRSNSAMVRPRFCRDRGWMSGWAGALCLSSCGGDPFA